MRVCGNGGSMAKRKITKTELASAISAHAGNVLAIARSLNVKPKTIYNALDAYGMRGDLDAARSRALEYAAVDALRSRALESAAVVIAKAPQKIRVALMMLAESRGGITKAELVKMNTLGDTHENLHNPEHRKRSRVSRSR